MQEEIRFLRHCWREVLRTVANFARKNCFWMRTLTFALDTTMRHKITIATIYLLFSTSTSRELDFDMSSPLRLSIQCNCGKVKASISSLQSAMPLRFVCYCKDCRGYYNTLNSMAASDPPPAKLDAWGGVDWTSIFPRDIEITEGKNLLKTCLIRPESKMRQVYCSSCYTPIFRFGAMSVLMNTNLIQEEDQITEVRFRIIGRDSLKGADKKPKMSWSVPFSWFWVMPKRVKKDLMAPMPLELDDFKDVPILENFKQG